jgi:hypothetical protein
VLVDGVVTALTSNGPYGDDARWLFSFSSSHSMFRVPVVVVQRCQGKCRVDLRGRGSSVRIEWFEMR